MGSEVFNQFCQNQPEYKQPTRSSVTSTSAGNKVTGNEVGRSEKVTGDEPGTCKNVTGDEYLGSQQYESFCKSKPKAEAMKVGVSLSNNANEILSLIHI